MMQSWLVFKQDTEKKPHQMVGSVRAADSSIALLQARSVFARRPKAVSMWVAPASACFSQTREEMDGQSADFAPAVSTNESELETWQVFRKVGQRRSMTFVDHVGKIEANSAESAILIARDTFSDNKESWVWMVVPDATITRSDPDNASGWFDPAQSKTYKQQSAYGSIGGKRRGRSQAPKKENE